MLTTTLIELITLIGRFGLNISSKNIWIKTMNHVKAKSWFHFHHVFLGIIAIAISLINYHPFLLATGIGIGLSDMIHHVILWVIVGNPEFHLIYKTSSEKNGRNKLHKHLIHSAVSRTSRNRD